MKPSVKPESCAWLMPMLTVNDIEASLTFYHQAFGFESGLSMPDEQGRLTYADMLYQGKQIIMMMVEGVWDSPARTPKHSETDSPVSLYVYCTDVDALCKQAAATKAEIISQPQDMFWGDRTCAIKDPDGHVWTFATHIADVDFADMAAH